MIPCHDCFKINIHRSYYLQLFSAHIFHVLFKGFVLAGPLIIHLSIFNWLYMYIYVYTCICMYTHIHTPTNTHVYVHIYVRIYRHTYVRIYVFIHMHIYSNIFVYRYMYTCIHLFICMYVHTYILHVFLIYFPTGMLEVADCLEKVPFFGSVLRIFPFLFSQSVSREHRAGWFLIEIIRLYCGYAIFF